jgi:cell wall-associated NlpC family hydrolase
MPTAPLRCGGVALASVLTLSGAVNASAGAAPKQDDPAPATERAVAKAVAGVPTDATRTAIRTAAIAVLPKLSMLDLPELGGALASTGYAGRDLLVDLAPDLPDRDLDFVLQFSDGTTWHDVHAGTTSAAAERAALPSVPAGTYRVAVPAQFGLAAFTSEPFAHTPRQLAAAVSFDRGSTTTSVEVNPDPAPGASYAVQLQRWDGTAWVPVADQQTAATGTHSFADLPSGRYRAAVADQADALGTVSNEVDVVSKADLEAAARAAAAQAQAREAAERAAVARQTRPQAATTPSGRAAAAAPADPAPAANAGGIVGTALGQVGKAYRLGSTGPGAFDCSGLTSYAYRAAGKSIPRTAASQYAAAAKVTNPQPGDLVFFLRNGAQHVGVYLGGGRMVHAANPGRGVEVTSFSSGWYARSFTGYGRF